MKRILMVVAACALAAPAAHAQAIRGLNPAGHAALAWGADSAGVSRHWREQPRAVKREGAVARLSFLPWLGMDTWTVAVHDQHGFVQVEAMSGAGVTGEACERQFRQFVSLFQRAYRQLTPAVSERNEAGAGLCEAVGAGRGEARYHWRDPVNGSETVVEVNRAGRVAFQSSAPQYREWLAASSAPAAAPVAAAPPPAAPAAAPTVARITGFDSRLWDPQAKAVTIPWGATRADIVRIMGRAPTLESPRNMGPGMTGIYYVMEGYGFIVHNRDGLIQAGATTGFTGPGEPCAAFFERLRARVASAYPDLTPRGVYTFQGSGDLCDAVKTGARAAWTWTDPVNRATVRVGVGRETGAIGVFFATPQYNTYYDNTPDGRIRQREERP